ncbi:hypothetical protein [Nocardiopsis sp. LOL_012]|uniref:hypothetical protein n=1 Tax=Nocardiopsis sp. LOL_012 TaxID=3345409 RepID=UPI003A8A1214
MLKSPLASGTIAATTAISLMFAGLSPAAAKETMGMNGQEMTQADTHLQASPEEVNAILAQELTEEELSLVNEYFFAAPEGEVETQALPAVVIAVAAWCARGALASVPTTALTDIINGGYSGWETYAMNAAVGCLVGEVGGVAWRLVPQAAKEAAIRAVFVYYLSIRGPE